GRTVKVAAAEQGVALRPGPHFCSARDHALAAGPAGELDRSPTKELAVESLGVHTGSATGQRVTSMPSSCRIQSGVVLSAGGAGLTTPRRVRQRSSNSPL